jgi:hypothetical protein
MHVNCATAIVRHRFKTLDDLAIQRSAKPQSEYCAKEHYSSSLSNQVIGCQQ